jgi:hypothetical protein
MSSPTTSKELNLANFVVFDYKGEYEPADIQIPDNIYVLTPDISGASGYVNKIDFRKIYEGKTPVFTTTPITSIPSTPPSTTASTATTSTPSTPPSTATTSPPSTVTTSTPSTPQWKLYGPAETIKNIKINSETNCADVSENNKQIMAGDTGNNFIIYADSGESPYTSIEIGDESAFTVKICKDTNLQDIFKLLTEAQTRNNDLKSPKIKTPIILVPFISNDSPNMFFEKFEDTSILDIFTNLCNDSGKKLPETEYIESPLKSSQVKTEPLTTSEINENVEEFKKKLKDIIKSSQDANKLQIFNEKTNKFPIKVKTYANSDFIIFKLVGDEFREINANNPEENAVGNAILTFFKYSKTSISYNNTKATIKCSLTYKKNDVPLYLKMGNDYYKLRKRK